MAAALINLLGFLTGTALYAMLLAMVLKGRRVSGTAGDSTFPIQRSGTRDSLPLLTALLGLIWNLGGLLSYGVFEFRSGHASASPAMLLAGAFVALGFLPAVVVHSVLRTEESFRIRGTPAALVAASYALSAIAGIQHLYEALRWDYAPSHWALHVLTAGFGTVIVCLLVLTREQGIWKRAGWAIALAVFAVSAQHLSHHEGHDYPLWIEVMGHHASLPLAFAILYQDYRFALADLFLKRALVLVLLVGLAFALYAGIAAPRLGAHFFQGQLDPFAVGLILSLWVVTALLYPVMQRAVNRVVDSWLLGRADYDAVRASIGDQIATLETPEAVLDALCPRLSAALTARDLRWAVNEPEAPPEAPAKKSGRLFLPQIDRARNSRWLRESKPGPQPAIVSIPTATAPHYHLLVGELAGGRRLMSDDLSLLDSVASMAARRIDAVRVIHERCMRDLQEQEIHNLATEAELRALRAQINPHFLFNALTTLGYLIQTSPDRAQETLMRLTTLLRAVLRHSDGEFTTIGEELELIESYLEIERARFEERLRVHIDVAEDARTLRIPSLLIQPLVENAIKHGVSPSRTGGDIFIEIHCEPQPGEAGKRCRICVRDTGAGASEIELAHGRRRGVGLANIEQRIVRHYGEAAHLRIRTARGEGATVELELPVSVYPSESHAAAGLSSRRPA